jgi:multisubunit Na+/H+ antiporter MnhE subunit
VVRRAAIALLTWALLFGVWMLLVDNDSLPELLTGVGASALAAIGSELVRAQRIAEVRIRPRWLARAWRPFARIPLDVGILMWALLRPRRTRGQFRALRFRVAGDDPESTSRRAFAEVFGSLAPNTYVIGVDPRRRVLIVHQLVRRGDPETALDPLDLR